MPPPLPRCSGWAYSSLISPSRVSLPRKGRRVGLHIDIFEACSAFTRVAACTLALSPIRDTLIEGFSHFVTSMTAPIASGWSESPGGPCTHWKAPPCHGARRNRPSACHRPGPAELPQTTRRDGTARAGQCLCQTARSIRRKPLLFNANTQTETFVAPCRDFITFLFVCSHAADIRHEDTGLPWDIGADVP